MVAAWCFIMPLCATLLQERANHLDNNDRESPSVTNSSYTSLKQPGNNCEESGNPVPAAPFWVIFCRQWEKQREGGGKEPGLGAEGRFHLAEQPGQPALKWV